MEWNDETIARLRLLWDEGLSTAEIGRRLGVSKNAVVGKAHRMMLPPRPSPIRRDGAATPRSATPRRVTGPTLPPLPADCPDHPARAQRVVSRPAPRENPSASSGVVVPDAPIVAVPVVAVRAVVRPDVEPAVAHLPPTVSPPPSYQSGPIEHVPPIRVVPPSSGRHSSCCWPLGEPGTRSFRFCDAAALAAKPYCAEHAQLAYVKVRDRREEAA